MSIIKGAAYLFVLPVLLPLLYKLLVLGNSLGLILFVMSFVYLLFVLKAANYINTLVLESLKLNHQQRDLLTNLARRQKETEKVNKELAIALEDAKQASKAKSQFLANMSHEDRLSRR